MITDKQNRLNQQLQQRKLLIQRQHKTLTTWKKKKLTGTVVGVYDTTAYEVTYDDTETGETVANHKWVVHEELENAQDEPYQAGDEVVLEASHMPGMKGATATVDSAEKTNMYMVTYTDTESGEKIENHKWMSEDELSQAE